MAEVGLQLQAGEVGAEAVVFAEAAEAAEAAETAEGEVSAWTTRRV
ncbi:MAG: hypothetical protein OXG47_08520 [bacterium]|nr:hypothetical protein [bacterium]